MSGTLIKILRESGKLPTFDVVEQPSGAPKETRPPGDAPSATPDAIQSPADEILATTGSTLKPD